MIENPILKTIFERKSIRKFKSKKVSRETIEQIVRAGQRAPTACRMETYSFVVISDSHKKRQILQAIARHVQTREFMEEASLWIMICTDFARQLKLLDVLGIKNEFGEVSKFILGVIDAALAAENMVLAAEALGLGSCFVGNVWTAPISIAEILNLPKNVLPIVLLCVGYPNETPSPRPRWPLEAVLHENEYEMASEQLMRDYSRTRENWKPTYPYKLSKEVEQKIRKDIKKLGFIL